MEKLILIRADRGPNMQLDFRKNPLGGKNDYYIFKVDGNEVLEYDNTYISSFKGSPRGLKSFIQNSLKGKGLKPNRENGGIYSNYISKDVWKKYYKKALKCFDVVEIDPSSHEEIIKEINEQSNKFQELIDNKNKEIEKLKVVDYENKNGRLRKINYKNNLYITPSKKVYISNDRTYLIAGNNDRSFGDDFVVYDKPVEYYSLYPLVRSNDGFGKDGKIFKLGKRKVQKFIDMYLEIENQENLLIKIMKNYIRELVK